MIRAQVVDKPPTKQTIAVLETELDDLNPELFSHLYELFLNHPSVLDFYTTPVFMKKNRPGTLITILASPEAIAELANLLMRESGSLGVRYRLQEQMVLPRSEKILQSPWGPVRVKLAQFKEGEVHLKPEYEDCHAIDVKNGLPLLDVYATVQNLLNP